MRMWIGVSVDQLCRKHLLGEHVELHMLVGHLKRGRRLGKLAEKRFVEPLLILIRHLEISIEMKRRGYRHRSVMRKGPNLKHLPRSEWLATVDQEASRRDLLNRCSECRRRGSEHE